MPFKFPIQGICKLEINMTARSHEMLLKDAVEGFKVLYTFFFFFFFFLHPEDRQKPSLGRQRERENNVWLVYFPDSVDTIKICWMVFHHWCQVLVLLMVHRALLALNHAPGRLRALSVLPPCSKPFLSPFISVAVTKLWDFLANMAGEEGVWGQEAGTVLMKENA